MNVVIPQYHREMTKTTKSPVTSQLLPLHEAGVSEKENQTKKQKGL